jgi:hypothetical protein
MGAPVGAELLARTDADALPRPDWTSRIRRRFARGAEVICGASVPRGDERPTLAECWVLPAVQRTLAIYGRLSVNKLAAVPDAARPWLFIRYFGGVVVLHGTDHVAGGSASQTRSPTPAMVVPGMRTRPPAASAAGCRVLAGDTWRLVRRLAEH